MWKGQREKIRGVISTKPNDFLSVYNWVKKLEFKVGPVLMSTFKRDRQLVVRFVQIYKIRFVIKKTSEYDQEIPQSHTADQPMESRGRATRH